MKTRSLLGMFVFFAVSSAGDQLDDLARRGKIHEDASVKASLESTVDASPERVWDLLSDVKDWPNRIDHLANTRSTHTPWQ